PDIDPVAVLAGGRAVAGVEPPGRPPDRRHDHLRSEDAVHRAPDALDIDPPGALEGRDLPPRVHAGVRAASHRERGYLPEHPVQRFLEHALNGPLPRLSGPAPEIG